MAGNITIGNMTSLDAGNVTSTLLVPVVKPGTLTNYHTQLGNLSGAVGIEITDGTHDVTGATKLTVTGGTVGGTTPNATLDVSGSGSGGITLTAGTNLAAGTGVAVNGSGEAVQTWGPAPNIASAVTSALGVAAYWAICPLDATHFVIFVDDATGSAIIPASVSGTTITLGTRFADDAAGSLLHTAPPQFNSGGLLTANTAALSASSFLIVYPDGSNFLQAKAYTISAGVVTAGTPTAVDAGNATLGTAVSPQVVALSSTSFVVSYLPSGGEAVAGTVTGTTVAVGTPVTWASTTVSAIVALDSSHVLISYPDTTNSGFMTCVVGHVVTTVLTLGTPVAVASFGTTTSPSQPLALTGALFVQTWTGENAGGSGTSLLAVAGTVSGTAVTLGTVAVLTPTTAQQPLPVPLAALDASHFVASLGTAALSVSICSISGTTITPASALAAPLVPIPASTPVAQYGPGGGSPNNTATIAAVSATTLVFSDFYGTIYGASSTAVSFGITHPGTMAYAVWPKDTASVYAVFIDPNGNLITRIIANNAINSLPIGFTASDVTSTNPATIQQSGSCSGFSGLTVGAQYYFNGDGTITTADTGHPAGVALTTSTLAIKMAG